MILVKQNRSNTAKKYVYLLSIMLGLPLTGLLILGIDGDHHFNTLPYYSVDGAMEEWSEQAQRVGSFELTNQDGATFNSEALEGKVWIAAFFPTNAAHVAQFTKQLLWPNFRYRDENDIMTVCFTLDAEYDRPEILKKYVDRNTRYNGFDGKWQFLTGDQNDIDALIRESFMIQRDESEPNNIATLWLVDGSGYLRGVYHAASEDAIKDAVEDIALLQKEMDEASYERKKSLEKLTLRYYEEIFNLGKTVMSWLQMNSPQEIWTSLEKPFEEYLSRNQTLLRILRYPPLTGNESPNAMRAGAHEDINLITMLPAANESGLEIKPKTSNAWIPIEAPKGSIIINIGDMLQELSNGLIPSTTHRVINPSGSAAKKARLTAPIFCHPYPEMVLSERYTAKSYLHERLSEINADELRPT